MGAPVHIMWFPVTLDDVLRRNLKFPGSYICRALAAVDTRTFAAVDTALIDLRAKIAEQPAWRFLGCTPDPVAVLTALKR